MNFTGSNCGCDNNYVQPTYQQCNQVVQTCEVEDVPHYMNYHTHLINNHVIRHINIPTYSTSNETVYINEYVQGQPVYYNQPIYYNQPMYQQPTYQQPMYYTQTTFEQGPMVQQQPMYKGNVGYQGMVNPINPPFTY